VEQIQELTVMPSKSKFSPKYMFINMLILVYVDANPACNTLQFQMGPSAVGTTLAARQWNIKVH